MNKYFFFASFFAIQMTSCGDQPQMHHLNSSEDSEEKDVYTLLKEATQEEKDLGEKKSKLPELIESQKKLNELLCQEAVRIQNDCLPARRLFGKNELWDCSQYSAMVVPTETYITLTGSGPIKFRVNGTWETEEMVASGPLKWKAQNGLLPPRLGSIESIEVIKSKVSAFSIFMNKKQIISHTDLLSDGKTLDLSNIHNLKKEEKCLARMPGANP